MFRYINASDVPKLLGKEYQFFWTTALDIKRIIFGIKTKNELQSAIEQLPEETLAVLAPGENSKKRKCEAVMNYINDSKKTITESETHSEYVSKESNFVSQLPHELHKLVQKDFTMERGNVEEARIIKEYSIPKTNTLKYYTFNVDGTWYKLGSRFDGPQIEIKTRKNKFMGVPDYENVQLHIYMATSNKNEWVLKEKFNDQTIDHQIFFDERFFEKIKNDIHKNWEFHLKK
jgi:hypothetical protein